MGDRETEREKQREKFCCWDGHGHAHWHVDAKLVGAGMDDGWMERSMHVDEGRRGDCS